MLSFNYLRRAFRATKYGKVALTVLFVGLIAASMTLGGGLQAPDPTAAAGALGCSAAPSVVGVNAPTTVTATGGNGTYAWSSNQQGSSQGNRYTVSFPNPGTKTIRVTSGAESATCDVQVTDGTPTSNLIVSCSASPSNPVAGGSVTWTATARGGNGTYAYNWIGNGSFPDGATTNPVVATYGAAGGKQAQVTVTSGNKTEVATCDVTVGSGTPAPTPLTVSCSGSPSTINPGGTVTWRANASGGNGSYSYSWTGNGSFPSGVTGNPVSHTYLGGAGQRNANVTVTSGGQTATGSCHIQVEDPGTPGNPGSGCQALQFSEVTLSGNSASARVTNPNPAGSNCSQSVGLVSYDTSAEPYQGSSNRQAFLEKQVLTDSELVNVAPNTWDKNFTVSIRPCEFQVDFFKGTYVPTAVQIDTGAGGIQLMKWKVSSGIATVPGYECPQVQLSCTANPSSAQAGDNVSFTAHGGNGSYSWSVNGGGTPSTGTGSIFNTSFNTVGTKTATVTSGGRTATCPVTIWQTTQNPPSCTPSSQTVSIGESANVFASGGNGSYSWSVNGGGTPGTGSGQAFHPSFSTSGTKTITLTSNGQSAVCTVVVQPQVTNDISCSPLNQNADVNEAVFFSASGGDGAFHWTASGGSPSTGNSQQFQTSWNSTGPKHALVSDNSGHTAQCNVQVNPVVQDAPVCAPSSQNANIDDTVNFTATGGNGSFSWSVNGSGASRSSGNGSHFDTSFSVAGNKTVTVTSNGKTDTCIVNVEEEQQNDLSCSPSNQDADVDEWVTFRARGGSGSYRWTANDGDADPDSDTGSSFTTRFGDEGRHTVRVRDSRGNSATCRVDVQQDFTPRRPSCTPSSQTASVNEQVEFFANGGTGDYEWDARDGRPRSGFGSRFKTSFDSPGRYEVELDSNGETDTCEVEIVQENNGAPFCSPSSQNANVNDFVTFTASGGDGSFTWTTSADGTPTTGFGSSFGTRFLTPGNKLVSVSSNGRTSQCVVQIGSVLGASTVVTGPTETAGAAAGLGFLGALGAYGAVYKERSKKLISKITRLVRR